MLKSFCTNNFDSPEKSSSSGTLEITVAPFEMDNGKSKYKKTTNMNSTTVFLNILLLTIHHKKKKGKRMRTNLVDKQKVKILRKRIKEYSTKENIKSFLERMGYKVNDNFMFKIRQERTPSASIRHDGYIKDFGSGWSGDIVALLHEFHDIGLTEAVYLVAEHLGIGE